jgi:imidazolonepropionase
VFCDQGAYSVDEARAILTKAWELGFGLRLHGNQLGHTGGVALAVEMNCASVDHCTYLSDEDVALLASSDTVATLLPGAEFSTRSPYPNAKSLLQAGVSLALATDCNPGTSYVTNMPLMIALAVREMGMTPDEALFAATGGGAKALRRNDVGHLGIGAKADVVVLNGDTSLDLAYRIGSNVVAHVL